MTLKSDLTTHSSTFSKDLLELLILVLNLFVSPSPVRYITNDNKKVQKILIGNEASLVVANALGKGTYTIVPSFVTDFKAIENQTELEGFFSSCSREQVLFTRASLY